MISFIQTNFTAIVTFLTLISNILFVIFILTIFGNKNFKEKTYKFVHKNIAWILLILSIIAVTGSLTYSEIVGYVPCDLCWWQRIFMYPQVILGLIAVWKGDKSVVNYVLPLSIIGGLIAFFHSLVHWRVINASFLACTSSQTAPCAKVYVLQYGYITIPFMALTMFIYLTTVSIIYLKANAKERGNDSYA